MFRRISACSRRRICRKVITHCNEGLIHIPKTLEGWFAGPSKSAAGFLVDAMPFLIANIDPVPFTEVFRAILFYGILAEIVGVPAAWFRVRKLEAWKERPEEFGRIGLLSRYIAKITGLVILWGVLVILAAVIGSRV
jgi:hypothetical protein